MNPIIQVLDAVRPARDRNRDRDDSTQREGSRFHKLRSLYRSSGFHCGSHLRLGSFYSMRIPLEEAAK